MSMPKPNLKEMMAVFVRLNELYLYVEPERIKIVIAMLTPMAKSSGTTPQILYQIMREEIMEQRELRGLCRSCGEKTEQIPNLCIQCAMREWNEAGEIPFHRWLSPQ